MGDFTLFEALTGGAFDRLNWQHSGEFDQNFSKKSNDRGFARGGMGGFGIDRYITCDLHKIELAHKPQLFILLTGNILIPRAVTFLVGRTITKVS